MDMITILCVVVLWGVLGFICMILLDLHRANADDEARRTDLAKLVSKFDSCYKEWALHEQFRDVPLSSVLGKWHQSFLEDLHTEIVTDGRRRWASMLRDVLCTGESPVTHAQRTLLPEKYTRSSRLETRIREPILEATFRQFFADGPHEHGHTRVWLKPNSDLTLEFALRDMVYTHYADWSKLHQMVYSELQRQRERLSRGSRSSGRSRGAASA